MEVVDVIHRIPALADWSSEDMQIQRLGGLTNDNYRLITDGMDCILRLPRESTNRWINRAAEQHNLDIAIAAGLAPAYRHFESSGVMLSDSLPDSIELTAALLQDPSLLRLLGQQLRRLHDSQPVFKGQVDLAALIERYFHLMSDHHQRQQADRFTAIKALLHEQINTRDNRLVSSHNDLVLQNLLLQEDRIWLIDWEYSGLASPFWDLATICNELDLDDSASAELLSFYDAGESGLSEQQLAIYRTLLGFLSDCWLQAFHPPC